MDQRKLLLGLTGGLLLSSTCPNSFTPFLTQTCLGKPCWISPLKMVKMALPIPVKSSDASSPPWFSHPVKWILERAPRWIWSCSEKNKGQTGQRYCKSTKDQTNSGFISCLNKKYTKIGVELPNKFQHGCGVQTPQKDLILFQEVDTSYVESNDFLIKFSKLNFNLTLEFW